jgi:nucleoside-diphosphate-sugar epimerase
MTHKPNLTEDLERTELINKLKKAGFGHLIKALIEHEDKAYTKRSRLNKSGACRVLGWKTKELEDALAQCREVLKDDFE